jgi:hypothetical protein
MGRNVWHQLRHIAAERRAIFEGAQDNEGNNKTLALGCPYRYLPKHSSATQSRA